MRAKAIQLARSVMEELPSPVNRSLFALFLRVPHCLPKSAPGMVDTRARRHAMHGPSCHHDNRAERRFCAECGAARCAACGASNEPAQKFFVGRGVTA